LLSLCGQDLISSPQKVLRQSFIVSENLIELNEFKESSLQI